jgi:lipoprotein-releasing system permease protein
MRLFVALRYFSAHKRQSLVCIAGVTIAVLMYIVITSMFEGFKDKFIVETVESTGHITVRDEPRETRTPLLELAFPVEAANDLAVFELRGTKPRETVKKIKNPGGIIAKIRHLPGVEAVSAVVRGSVIATFGTKTYNLEIYGVDPDQHTQVTTIGKQLLKGSFERLQTAGNGVVVGSGVARQLGLQLDDIITLSSNTGGKTTAKVVGVFETGVVPIDLTRAYMLITNAQTLLDKKNIVNDISIRTDNHTAAPVLAAQIESITGYKTEPWQETNANFLRIFVVQNLVGFFITMALLIVAGFGVLNIQVMAVLERVGDIAILKSLGLSRQDITMIYLFQGVVIGVVGAGLGLGLGKLAVEGLRALPIELEGLVKSEGLLMSEDPATYATAVVSAIAVTLLASVYPARRAASYDPVEVIRGAH